MIHIAIPYLHADTLFSSYLPNLSNLNVEKDNSTDCLPIQRTLRSSELIMAENIKHIWLFYRKSKVHYISDFCNKIQPKN